MTESYGVSMQLSALLYVAETYKTLYPTGILIFSCQNPVVPAVMLFWETVLNTKKFLVESRSLFYCVTYDKSYSVLYKTRMLQVPFWLAVALLVILTLTSPSAKKNWRALQFDVNPDKPTTPSAIYPFRTQEARISAELLPGISYGAEITTTKRLPFVSLSLFKRILKLKIIGRKAFYLYKNP